MQTETFPKRFVTRRRGIHPEALKSVGNRISVSDSASTSSREFIINFGVLILLLQYL